MKSKVFVVLLLVMLLISIGSIVYGKYVLETDSFLAIETNLDRTPPNVKVTYSTTDPTNQNVIATITSNEPMKEKDGWTLSDDKLSMTKTYEVNNAEDIEVFDVAGNRSIAKIDIQNIDKVKPVVVASNITNSNTSYPGYANKAKTITMTVTVTDNVAIKDVDLSKITVKVGEKIVNPSVKWKELSSSTDKKEYTLTLTGITGDGKLQVIFDDGFATDTATNNNEVTSIDTKILIDNTAPKTTYSQTVLSNGKVNAVITSNEQIAQNNGWNISSDNKKINKDFVANTSYEITITDYAGNETVASINITGATYINLIYASHNSEVGWTYGYGNKDVAGKAAILDNAAHKTEAMAFRITGGVSSDFVRVWGFVYSYWNSTTDYGKCKDTGYKYKLRGAPTSNSNTSYYTMASSSLSTIKGQKYIQIGGSGINGVGNTDYNGNRPLPQEVIHPNNKATWPYGVSQLKISLKDYSELSVVYQVYVNGNNWLAPASNGQVTGVSTTKPVSAFRVAIVPTSETDNLIKTWNKDTGKAIK